MSPNQLAFAGIASGNHPVPRAQSEDSAPPSSRSGELTGLALLGLAVVLLIALVSYDRNDLATHALPFNDPPHNWLGRIGAWIADKLFFSFGAGAYVIVALLFAFGLAGFVSALAYLRRGWRVPVAAVGLLTACLGTFDLLVRTLPALGTKGNSVGPGGLLGEQLNRTFTVYFLNRSGAGLLYALIYLVSLVFLTDFHLLAWVKNIFVREPKTDDEKLAADQAALAKQSKELAKQARALEQKAAAEAAAKPKTAKPAKAAAPNVESDSSPAKSGVGPDLRPVPEPKFQDNSLPKPQPSFGQEAVTDGMTISASEIAAASPTDSVLGRKSALKSTAPAPSNPDDDWKPGQPEEADEAADPLPEDEDAIAAVVSPLSPVSGGNLVRGKMQPRRPKPITVASTPMIDGYSLPHLDLLNRPDLTVKSTETKEDYLANSRLMVQTLAQFGIEVFPGDITRGPTITRYELHPAAGVKLEKINALTNNLAAALKAERLNVLAPIPGKSSVGIEVPNLVKTKVIMRDLLESPEWQNSKARIPLALGKDVYGHPIIADLAEMPHVLIAGSTGSGKSVCINTIIASLLYKFGPDQLRFVMIDPKVVELQQYNALPHLVVPVVTDPKKVILALRWVVNEMEKRYQIFAKVGVRNIKGFNERPKDKPLPVQEPELPLMAKKEKVEPGAEGFAVEVDVQIVVPRDDDIVIPEKLSYVVVIIDELADLMLVAPADVEMAIARITQMARAAGIHCIVATQRPSVDVITGVIKANIPARIAFQVAAKVDSRTILDQMGADKLLGKGDMLYLPPGSAKLTRAQGALITDQEIEQLVEFIAKQGKPSYEPEIHQRLQSTPSSLGSMSLDPESDVSDADEELIEKCIEVIRTEKKASVSLLQRRLKLGYGRASRLMDELEDRGVVGPSKGAEPRDILLDLDNQGYDGGGQSMV
jgi:S-DNA-T family DNA segregation ATPase FtsK/SpoIIIE